jgi:hypothetical protein
MLGAAPPDILDLFILRGLEQADERVLMCAVKAASGNAFTATIRET